MGPEVQAKQSEAGYEKRGGACNAVIVNEQRQEQEDLGFRSYPSKYNRESGFKIQKIEHLKQKLYIMALPFLLEPPLFCFCQFSHSLPRFECSSILRWQTKIANLPPLIFPGPLKNLPRSCKRHHKEDLAAQQVETCQLEGGKNTRQIKLTLQTLAPSFLAAAKSSPRRYSR